MIEIKNLKKSFGTKRVLKGIDLKIEDKDRVAIIGPSGCGKSTLLRCINRLETPTSGDVYFKGKKINNNPEELSKIRAKMGMIFQQFNLFPHLTVLENITLAQTKLNILDEKTAEKKAKELLKMINLEEKANMYPSELSGGQQQRVAIVRSLIMNPDIILADEPTSALDPEMVGGVIDILKQIADQGMTMVVVTHEMKFIESFATKVIFMEDGKIVESGTSKEILHNPKSPRLKEFLSIVNKR